MKKTLSIFMTLAMLFCLSANLFAFAADEPVKANRSQISASEEVKIIKLDSKLINKIEATTILACGAVMSTIVGYYFYNAGYQQGWSSNWLSNSLLGKILSGWNAL